MEDLTRLPDESGMEEFPELTKDQIDVLLKVSVTTIVHSGLRI